MRLDIEEQLNKAVLTTGLIGAFAIGNPRGLDHAEEEGQEIAKGCNRLVSNSIICWNYLYPSRLVEAAKTPEERDRILKMIAMSSRRIGNRRIEMRPIFEGELEFPMAESVPMLG